MTARAEEIAADVYPDLFIRDDKMKTSGTALISDAAQMLRREGFIKGYKQGQQDAQPSPTEDLEGQAQRFFMAWPNGDIPAMLAAFARSLGQPSAPTVDVHAIAEDLTAHLAKMSLPTDPHGWKVIVRIALIGRLTKLLTNT